MKLEKPKLDVKIIEGNFYWVRHYNMSEFEPARCKKKFLGGRLYFCFTDGGIVNIEQVWEVKELKYLNN